MNKITMYTRNGCGACDLSKQLLDKKMDDIKVINISEQPEERPDDLTAVPKFVQITTGGSVVEHVGFASEEMLEHKGFQFK